MKMKDEREMDSGMLFTDNERIEQEREEIKKEYGIYDDVLVDEMLERDEYDDEWLMDNSYEDYEDCLEADYEDRELEWA